MASETQPLLRNSIGNAHADIGGHPAAETTAATATATITTTTTTTTTTAVDVTAADDELGGGLDDPHAWPQAFKWSIVLALAAMGFTVTFTCISIVPIAAHIVDELNAHNSGSTLDPKAASVLVVTIWELGEAVSPLVVAPLSETPSWGRYAVLNAATLLFVAATAAAAAAPSTFFFIAARGLTGVAVATNVLAPAIIGDVFPPDQRGSAMALLQLAPLIGGAVGPAVGGALAGSWGWRAVLWLSDLLAASCSLIFLFAFRETYSPAIRWKRQQAYRLQRERAAERDLACQGSGKTAATVRVECLVSDIPEPETPVSECRAESDTLIVPDEPGPVDTPVSRSAQLRRLRDAVLRPAVVVADSMVLVLLSMYGATSFSFFYIMSVSLPPILETRYGLSSAATGSSFLSFSAGALVSVVLCNQTLDRIYVYMTSRSRRRAGEGGERSEDGDGLAREAKPGGRPEYRLPLVMLSGLLLPATVAVYGWCAELLGPLWLMLGCVFFMGISLVVTTVPLVSYIVDAFGLFSASALTGFISLRCICGTFLPLTIVPLIDALGYGWGFMVLAAGSLVLMPLPLLVMCYGEQWRQLSKYTRTERAEVE